MFNAINLEKISNKIHEIIDNSAFDERDHYPTFEEIIEMVFESKPTGEEKGHPEYPNIEKNYKKVIEAAESVAYQNRAGNKKSIAEAKTNLDKAMCNV
jgi:hypothetical protein